MSSHNFINTLVVCGTVKLIKHKKMKNKRKPNQFKGCTVTEFEPKMKFSILKEGEIAPEETGEPFQLSATQWYDPKAQKMFSDFEKRKEQEFKERCQKGDL